MLSFKEFITEGRGFIKGGMDAQRHEKQYITPYLGKKETTHVVGKDHGDVKAGTKVRLHKTENINGKLHVHVSDEKGKKSVIPVTKLHKPGEEPVNKGHKYETDTIERWKKHGITPKNAQGAGSTSGTDAPIWNKKKDTMQKGRVKDAKTLINGELKNGVSAAFGQLTIRHDKEKGGWHIPDEARKKRPRYAKAIEDAGIIAHMNKHHKNPEKDETTASGRSKSLTFEHPNLEPAHSYLKDHHVHVLHVGGGYGTYRVGAKDETGHGLPKITGKGRWTVREKQAGQKKARTVLFQPAGAKGLNKSHVDLDKDEHMHEFKKTLGHK